MQRANRLMSRWSFLDKEPDACVVVTRRMEIVYLNPAASALVPSGSLGLRCWDAFPVGEAACAARCPAVRAVSKGADLVYCEETLYPAKGPAVPVGVVVIPLLVAETDGGRALLLLRPSSSDLSEEAFRRELLEKARRLRRLCG